MNNHTTKETWILSGRYKIIEQIGIGGMSYVYKAIDKNNNKIVAIKILKDELANDDEFIQKFKSETLASEKIEHENVVKALDVVDDGSLHYLVLEYVEGLTLNKYIKDKKHLSNEETIKLSIEIASGLLYAHKKGIIHIDVKPQNIIIKNDGTPKIMDFGIARVVSSSTRNISIVETVHYISPEQARNENIDYRSDIYSLGCTMYEMITGEIPFKGDNPVSIIVSHIRENIKKPSEINKNIYKSLEKIILKCTQMLPKDRYQTMAELIKDLKKASIDKDGLYISDIVYHDETDNQTMIISDKDMQLIKDMPKNYQNDDNKRILLTDDQKTYIKKYIKKTERKKRRFLYLVCFLMIICILILILLLYNIVIVNNKQLNERSQNNTIENINNIILTDEKADIIFNNLKASLPGLNVYEAIQLTKNYGINLNIVKKEFNDTYDKDIILEVLSEQLQPGNILDICVSMGSEVIDFTNIDKINNTSIEEMEEYLNDRNLQYSIIEQYDKNVEKGNIIGVNKTDSSKSGMLIFTVSLGAGNDIVVMPSLINKTYEEAKQLLSISKLIVGEITYMKNNTILEGRIISQSIESGKEVEIGSKVDIVVSVGVTGENSMRVQKEKWTTDFIETYIVNKNNIPINNNKTVVIAVRLMQYTINGVVYTELTQPSEYREGTAIPLVFASLEGISGIDKGIIQVVDVENDKVLMEYDVSFKKE